MATAMHKANTQNPTPCPPPKQRTSAFPAAIQDITLTDEYTRRFVDAKPRRPKGRKSMAWDPTVDIFEDERTETGVNNAGVPDVRRTGTEAVNEIQRMNPPRVSQGLMVGRSDNAQRTMGGQRDNAQRMMAPQINSSEAMTSTRTNNPEGTERNRMSMSGARRSTLFSAPAQRSNGVLERPLQQPSRPESQVSNVLYHREESTQEIKKEPRRRSIFVPSENTTTTNLYPVPGASMRTANPAKRPRQSDVFMALIEEPEHKMTQQVSDEPLIRKPPRKSLAVAPKRAPLQNRSNLAQQTIYEIDVPGSGFGKENVPPGGVFVEKTAKRKSMMPPPPPVNMSRPRVSILPDETLDLSYIQENKQPQPVGTLPQLSESTKPSSPPVPKPASRAAVCSNSVLSQRSSAMRRASRLPEKFSVPRVGLANISEHFPCVQDDISKPELYEEDWLSHQEAAISNLINTLFDSGSGKRLRCDRKIRSKILGLYQDPSIPLLYKRLQASLRFGGLSISQDTLRQVARFKDDVGQKQRFLNFWLKTYNLDSLQCVAEVVVGREVPATSRLSEPTSPTGRAKKQAKILEHFLTTFIVRHDDKAKTRSTTIGALGLGQDDSQLEAVAHGWRRTVLRSLMMILLLDKAQTQGLFSCNLFQASSTLKSSTAVLRALCTLLVPSIGDATRVLTHLGYEVSHSQEPLEEHEYHVNNIAVDLRDGVLLTRLVEDMLYPPATFDARKQQVTLTLPNGDVLASKLETTSNRSWPLRQHLKYPAVGRSVMVYNVQLALSALRTVEDAQNVIDNIRAEDIVDGHREKTVSLLWNLLSRWGLDALVDADLLNKEIARLQHELTVKGDSIPSADVIVRSEPTWSRTKSAELLQLWAQCATAIHGVEIINLSTSFANGKAFKALMKEYSVPVTMQSGESQQQCISKSLRDLGCSHAFAALFDGVAVVPTARTTIPLLAFLASRLLPAAQPLIAARKIQRCWKKNRARLVLRQRLTLARIAHGCAVVVNARETIIWAAQVLQRRWREVLERRWAEKRHLPTIRDEQLDKTRLMLQLA